MKVTAPQLRDLIQQYAGEEITLSRFAEIINEKPLRELTKANEIIRSFHCVAERKGADTYWDGLMGRIKEILEEQHKIMYPQMYQ